MNQKKIVDDIVQLENIIGRLNEIIDTIYDSTPYLVSNKLQKIFEQLITISNDLKELFELKD